MSFDLSAAVAFVATHGRILERRRLDVLVNGVEPSGVLAALDAYRNPDRGYGWGLEPDLRSPESQPAAAMHALEVLAQLAPPTTPRGVELCDWLDANSVDDGALPFALPILNPAGCAPWWLNPDTTTGSLQTTAQVAANAHDLARHDRAVANHPWLARATRWCLTVMADFDTAPHAYELLFAVRLLDAVADVEPDATALLEKFGQYLPDDGVVPVQGGAAGESLRPLDFAPRAGPARRLFDDGLISEELRRLADGQGPDGGWTVEFESSSPAAKLEWRAYVTVGAIGVLAQNRS